MLKFSAFKTKYFNLDGVIILAFLSAFLPFYLTVIFVIVCGAYILIKKPLRRKAFAEKYNLLLVAFTIYTIITAICNLNFIGVGCSIGFLLMFAISLYFKSVISKEQFERGLNAAAAAGFVISILCFIDFLIFFRTVPEGRIYRTTMFFLNSNYLATLMATVVLICAYKVITKKGVLLLYYITAVLSMAAIYLTGSLFAWVEVFIGVAALLLMTRRHQMLSILLLLAATGCVVLYCVPGILPRLQEANITTDNRVQIWKTSLEALKDFPIFGRGFLTYFLICKNYPGAYATAHSHNIIIEPLLSFGIIGTALLLTYFVFYFKKVMICKNYQSKSQISALILAATAAALVHGTTDMTLMWVQTGLLFLLILSGIGYEEKLLKI